MPATPLTDAARFAHGPFGVYHLIGNVSEWVHGEDGMGWAVGGGWKTGLSNLDRTNERLLRPGEKAYEAMPLSDRKRAYSKYQIGFSKTYREEVGFRCALELR